MNYFQNCKTVEQVKARYKQLAKQHHPDCGGDLAIMQEVNAQYARAIAEAGKYAHMDEQEIEEEILYSEQYREAIEKIIGLQGITIELIGFWIWVTGRTKPVRQYLSVAGFHFAPKKQAWFFRTEDHKSRGQGQKSLDDIRSKYGSETVGNSRSNQQSYFKH